MKEQKILLSVICPSLISRMKTYAKHILPELERQAKDFKDVEVLALLDDGSMSIGMKMNRLTESARGIFVSAVGDDDMVTTNYIASLVEALERHPEADAVTFRQDRFVDGVYRQVVRERKGSSYKDEPTVIYRPISDKAAIRRKIRLDHPHKPLFWGEDTEFSDRIQKAIGLEVEIPKSLYRIQYRSDNIEGDDVKKRKDAACQVA